MKRSKVFKRLFIDQYGDRIYADTVKELREKAGGGVTRRMFHDMPEGPPMHVGYVVGRRWFTEDAVVERPA